MSKATFPNVPPGRDIAPLDAEVAATRVRAWYEQGEAVTIETDDIVTVVRWALHQLGRAGAQDELRQPLEHVTDRPGWLARRLAEGVAGAQVAEPPPGSHFCDGHGYCVKRLAGGVGVAEPPVDPPEESDEEFARQIQAMDDEGRAAPPVVLARLTDEQRKEIEDGLPKVGESEEVWTTVRGSTLRVLYRIASAHPITD